MSTIEPVADTQAAQELDSLAASHKLGALTHRWQTYKVKSSVGYVVLGLALIAVGVLLVVGGLNRVTPTNLVRAGFFGILAGVLVALRGLFRLRKGNRWIAIYENGVIDHQERRQPEVYDLRTWGVIGWSVKGNVTLTLASPDGTRVKLPLGDSGPDIFAPLLARSADLKWPTTLEKLQRGETLDFDDVKVSSTELVQGSSRLAWRDVTELKYVGKSQSWTINGSGFDALVGSTVSMPDPVLFMRVAEHLTGKPFQGAGNRPAA